MERRMLPGHGPHQTVKTSGGGGVVARRGSSTRTGGVLLRDVADGDLSTFFEHQQDPVANRMAGFPPRDRDAFVAHWKGILADGTVTKKTILFDGHVAGNVVSFEHSGRREVGYWIGGEYWGKGVATEALSQFLALAEARRPLYAAVARHNVGSIRVLEKCGFTVVGEEDGEYLLRLTADRANAAPPTHATPGDAPNPPG
jgi:RimJ/RimL family protein N-acetyltransferase